MFSTYTTLSTYYGYPTRQTSVKHSCVKRHAALGILGSISGLGLQCRIDFFLLRNLCQPKVMILAVLYPHASE